MPRELLLLVSVLILTLTTPAAHASSSPDDATVTWMVRPSDGEGEDGRSWVELSLDPGESVEEHLVVRNLSDAEVTFALLAADGYFTESGRFTILTSADESTGAGTWISIRETVTVAAGAEAVVPFTVTVPPNATPGDHAAGVAASVRSGGDGVGVEARVGFRVMTRVSGELAPSITTHVVGAYSGTWNPFAGGRLDVQYSVVNTGNTRLTITPRITATALFGLVQVGLDGEEVVEFSPGESRSGSVVFPTAWPLFAYTVELSAEGRPVNDALSVPSAPQGTSAATVVAVPWSQLLVIVLAAGLILWLRRHRAMRSE